MRLVALVLTAVVYGCTTTSADLKQLAPAQSTATQFEIGEIRDCLYRLYEPLASLGKRYRSDGIELYAFAGASTALITLQDKKLEVRDSYGAADARYKNYIRFAARECALDANVPVPTDLKVGIRGAKWSD